MPDASIDIAHARFAYFFGPGSEVGLAEVQRVLVTGGVFLVVDNSWNQGDFADLLRRAHGGNASIDPAETDAWWAQRGAERQEVVAGWEARSPEELERILRIEFAPEVVDHWVAEHPNTARLSYAYAVYVWRKPGP